MRSLAVKLNKLTNFILLLTTFVIPLIGPVKNLGFEQAKVFFFLIFLTLAGLLWLIYSINHPVKIEWTPIKKAAALLMAVLFLTSHLGIDRWNSFLGTQPYFQGFILYAYLFLFFLLISQSKIKFEYWAYVLAGSSAVVGILAIKDWILLNIFHVQIPTYAGRVVSTFGQPNFYAAFILFSLPFSYYLLVINKGRRSWALLAILMISILAIIISGSKSVFLLSILLLLIILSSNFRKKSLFRSSSFAVLIVITILIFVQFAFYFFGKDLWDLSLSDNPNLIQQSIEKRPYIWSVAKDITLDQPIRGYGLENINLAYANYFAINKHLLFEENLKISPVLISLKDLNINRTHNYPLDLLLFSGVLGLISWLLMIFFMIRKLLISRINLENSVLLIGLLTYLIWIQFQNQSIVHLIYFWLIAGLIDRDRKSVV